MRKRPLTSHQRAFSIGKRKALEDLAHKCAECGKKLIGFYSVKVICQKCWEKGVIAQAVEGGFAALAKPPASVPTLTGVADCYENSYGP